jgi:L-threonylcarbamoyladenylate synthase
MRPRQTRVRTVDREHPEPAAIAEAAMLLRTGRLVVFPTETVYGLGAHALDPVAVAAIFEAKGRPSTDPLIVHIGHARQLDALVRAVPDVARRLAERFWPGPLTLILPKRDVVPDQVTAGLDTVGVRVPSHPVALALLDAAAIPVAAPSANLFSKPSPTRVSHVLADLDGRVDLVLDAGPTAVGVESTVLDLTTPQPLVRRPGGVSIESLRAVVPDVATALQLASGDAAQPSPGQLLRHYAPRARMTLVEGEPIEVHRRVAREVRTRATEGVVVGVLAPQEDVLALRAALDAPASTAAVVFRVYGSRRDPEAAARELFDAIRSLDAEGVGEILAIALEARGIGAAIHDRLVRAAEGRRIDA